MMIKLTIWPRLAAMFCMALAAGAACAHPPGSPFVKARLVQVDVFDRVDGSALTVYSKHGRSYIVGTPGHEYAVRIRNCTNARVLVVTSVDGVNVISGDTASPSQSGYVLDAWGSVEIAGWRKSTERTAAFYFTDLGDSYAARTGRPQNVGIVGVAVFQEKLPAYAWQANDARAESAAPAAPEQDAAPSERKSMGKLGTGHGRSEESHVNMVAFERSTDAPLETVAIQYDRRENLIAMNVLPKPYYAQVPQPDPFPAEMRFAPDPVN